MSRRKSEFADNPWFADNLSAIMESKGVKNARLARWLGVSREIVGQWRRGNAEGEAVYPNREHFEALCCALECEEDDLLQPQESPQGWMPIAAWARREGIPTQRARDLFEWRILSGERRTPHTILVPVELKAPPESLGKRPKIVLMAKRRPRWVPIFHANFPRLVKEAGITYTAIGEQVGVQSNSVSHWANARNYPDQSRLPLIAKALGVPMQALIGDMRL